MESRFFDKPILNSPYEYPARHWELDDEGQPTQQIIESRRGAEFITPIPKPKMRGTSKSQQVLVLDEGKGLSTQEQLYDVTAMVNEIRRRVDEWRNLPNPSDWRVTPETARLLQHWRHYQYSDLRPFFCQVEAAETIIWLSEVAPKIGQVGRRLLGRLASANKDANPELSRLALKLATGAGKTTVMAMIIAWQTINAVRHPQSRRFTRGFLVVAPGITIKDRLRVLQPNDPDSYYDSRELVPRDMLGDLDRAKIVITNFHALRLRDRLELSKGGRALLQGRGSNLNTVETEGQMVQRVMPDLMGMKNIWVINDEGHHCYRQKPGEDVEGTLKGDDKREATKNSEAARVWISGIEIVKRRIGVRQVNDLSATPFFLRGSGYAEGTLFPWTVCDFSLMDAIECGIVKLPAYRWPTTFQVAKCPSTASCGRLFAVTCPSEGEANRRVISIHSVFRCSFRPPFKLSMDIMRRPSRLGPRLGLWYRHASLWSATTPPLPSSSMTTSPASTVRTKTTPRLWNKGVLPCSETLTNTGTHTPYPAQC